jgi:hypothetical protein
MRKSSNGKKNEGAARNSKQQGGLERLPPLFPSLLAVKTTVTCNNKNTTSN